MACLKRVGLISELYKCEIKYIWNVKNVFRRYYLLGGNTECILCDLNKLKYKLGDNKMPFPDLRWFKVA